MVITLENYRILKKCEGNGVNKIYVVESKASMKKYIIKIVELEKEEKTKQLQEIEIHQKLDYRYIVRLLDYEIENDRILIKMEFAERGDLFSFLKNNHDLTIRQILKLYYKICQSVFYLHKKKIIHRDIKPENIMLNKEMVPKLGDFGASGKKKVIKNTFCGTYEYMAPEIYLREQQTEKVDVWALGILLYEMLHFRTPFKNLNVEQVKDILNKKTVVFSKNLNPHFENFFYFVCVFDSLNRPSVKEILKHKIFFPIKNFLKSQEHLDLGDQSQSKNDILISSCRQKKNFLNQSKSNISEINLFSYNLLESKTNSNRCLNYPILQSSNLLNNSKVIKTNFLFDSKINSCSILDEKKNFFVNSKNHLKKLESNIDIIQSSTLSNKNQIRTGEKNTKITSSLLNEVKFTKDTRNFISKPKKEKMEEKKEKTNKDNNKTGNKNKMNSQIISLKNRNEFSNITNSNIQTLFKKKPFKSNLDILQKSEKFLIQKDLVKEKSKFYKKNVSIEKKSKEQTPKTDRNKVSRIIN